MVQMTVCAVVWVLVIRNSVHGLRKDGETKAARMGWHARIFCAIGLLFLLAAPFHGFIEFWNRQLTARVFFVEAAMIPLLVSGMLLLKVGYADPDDNEHDKEGSHGL